jgi:hypothetical protein
LARQAPVCGSEPQPPGSSAEEFEPRHSPGLTDRGSMMRDADLRRRRTSLGGEQAYRLGHRRHHPNRSRLHSRVQSAVRPWGPVRDSMKIAALAALFAAGFLLAGGLAFGRATQFTTTETTTTTVSETTTAPGTTATETTTVSETAPAETVATTVLQTTTRRVVVPPPSTTPSSPTASSTPTWVWVVLAILAAAVIGLAVALLTRHGGRTVSAAERRRRLDGAVATWTAQGWAVESETADSAILRRGAEHMVVKVDAAGQINVQPLSH